MKEAGETPAFFEPTDEIGTLDETVVYLSLRSVPVYAPLACRSIMNYDKIAQKSGSKLW